MFLKEIIVYTVIYRRETVISKPHEASEAGGYRMPIYYIFFSDIGESKLNIDMMQTLAKIWS